MFGIDDAIVAAGVGGGLSLIGGMMGNDARASQARDANAFSAQQFATRYQTTVKDMEAAGLNPMLAYSQGGGSPPSGQQAQMQDVVTPAVQSGFQNYSAARAGEVQKAQAELLKAQAENVDADTVVKRATPDLITAQTMQAGASADQARSTINNLEWQSKRISEEIKNIPKEGDRLVALVKQLDASRELLIRQGQTQEQATNQMKWLAVKTMLEGDLTKLDVDAALKFDNFGREYKQYAPIIDLLKHLFPSRR